MYHCLFVILNLIPSLYTDLLVSVNLTLQKYSLCATLDIIVFIYHSYVIFHLLPNCYYQHYQTVFEVLVLVFFLSIV
jgi:hypothetical protein